MSYLDVYCLRAPKNVWGWNIVDKFTGTCNNSSAVLFVFHFEIAAVLVTTACKYL